MIINKPSLKYLITLGLLLIIFTGCTAESPSLDVESMKSAEPPAEAGRGTQLEIMSPWSAGGGRNGFKALTKLYEQQNPGVEVIDAFDSGLSYAELIASFNERLQQQQPFDTWQVHPGDQVLNHVILGQVEPLTQIFEDQGLDQVMPPVLVEQATIKGEIYSIPINIHRANVLWYNPQIFEDNDLIPPKTMEDFFEVAEALKEKGIIPLALGGALGFEVPHLFESVLLATFGPEDYGRLFQADTDLWEDPRAVSAIATLQKMLAYTNDDRLEISWITATKKVLDGEAAMTVTGDWAKGFYDFQGAVPNRDYGWTAAPGTDGAFIWNSDGFVMATGAPNREAARAWIEVVASKAGQDAFNPTKGSIPARTDADRSLYGAYQQWSMDQYASELLVPSVVHGAAAPETYSVAYGDALVAFSKDLDETKLLRSLKAAVVKLE
jgi:glucose/mannose transport system substrate-binding protein